jgi:hypothetical protein
MEQELVSEMNAWTEALMMTAAVLTECRSVSAGKRHPVYVGR